MSNKLIKQDGSIEYRNSLGQLHREDGPATISVDGDMEWWYKGKPHRIGGPAYIGNEEILEEWWFEGKLHREDGPAVLYSIGTKEWYIRGELHREDGPAIEYHDERVEWYYFGNLHRIDGPAIITPPNKEEWYLRNKRIKKQNHPFYIFVNQNKLSNNIEEWPEEYKLMFKLITDTI